MTNNLRKIRERKGLSQLELGRRTGIAGNIISTLERGRIYPYPGWRRKLAAALEIPEDKIFPKEAGGNGRTVTG